MIFQRWKQFFLSEDFRKFPADMNSNLRCFFIFLKKKKKSGNKILFFNLILMWIFNGNGWYFRCLSSKY